jgi:hypothetical protein
LNIPQNSFSHQRTHLTRYGLNAAIANKAGVIGKVSDFVLRQLKAKSSDCRKSEGALKS